ncbi:MAG: hypothetical protein R3B99_04785 [Polyangiales bacterium]
MRFPLLLALALPASLLAAQAPPDVHVTRVEGPLPRRTIVQAFDAGVLRECQHTHMGHPLRFVLTIDPTGHASIDEVRAHEEIRSYVPCVRRHVAAMRFEAKPTSTRARVAVVFQPSGIGARP